MIGWREKERLRELYGYRCAYCGLSEVEAGGELTVDHFVPQAHGGTDTPENLVYACHACNTSKGDLWDDSKPLFLHPLHDDLSLHIRRDSDGKLYALTELGARHIQTLRLNRPALVARRLGRTRTAHASHKRRS